MRSTCLSHSIQAHFVEHVARLVENQTLEGIADVLDESDRDGMRVVIELKRNAVPSVVLNNLYKHTELQSRFACNMVGTALSFIECSSACPVIDRIGQQSSRDSESEADALTLSQFQVPAFLSCRDTACVIECRVLVIRRRAEFLLEKATQRLSIVVGLLKALENVEDLVRLLRQSKEISDARKSLCDRLELNEDQAIAITVMPMSRLTEKEVTKLEEEHKSLVKETQKLKSLLASDDSVLKEILDEARHIVRKFGDGRKSEMVEDEGDLSDMDVIPNNPMIITFSQKGYIKRMTPDTFSVQKRGGKGVHGAKMHGDDTMNEILHVMAHDQLLFFANDGRVFGLRAFQIPQSSRTATGSPLSVVLPGLKGTRVTSIFTLGDKV